LLNFNTAQYQPPPSYEAPLMAHSDPLSDFYTAMAGKGLNPNAINPDGKIQRFDIDKKNDQAGWYIFYDGDISAGAFGSWKTGEKWSWCSHKLNQLTPAQLQKYEEQRRLAQEERERATAENHENTKKAANKLLVSADDADPGHEYLVRKRVKAYGIKQQKDMLLVPAMDVDGTVWAYQRIWPDGTKKTAWNAKMSGCFFCIPGSADLYICEGYSTGCSIHEATGGTVICAFQANNVPQVTSAIRGKYTTHDIVICGDDDWEKEQQGKGNAGKRYATEAAHAINAPVVFPTFPPGTPMPGTDFNDLAALCGTDSVRMQIHAAKKMPIQTGPSFRLNRVGDLQLKPAAWLIKGILEHDTLAVLFGDPSTYKSFLAIDWACCIASGKQFHKFDTRRPGPVVYICGEGYGGITRRFHAWCIKNKIDRAKLDVFVSTAPAGLGDPDQLRIVIDQIATIGQTPSAIFVDTLSRNFSGDENSTSDMQAYIQAIDQLRRSYSGATVVMVHHSGHGDKSRARGSMVLKGAIDAEYRMMKEDGGGKTLVTLENTKMKDADVIDPLAFRPVPVDLPINDEDGNRVSSLVLDVSTLHEERLQQMEECLYELLCNDGYEYTYSELDRQPKGKSICQDLKENCPSFARSKHMKTILDSLLSKGLIEPVLSNPGRNQKEVLRVVFENQGEGFYNE
jgi:putative DNA primase/helicase